MSQQQQQQQQKSNTLESCSTTIGAELGDLTSRSNQGSHKLCQYALENVLLHQAAAQQLQVRGGVTKCVSLCV